jgi:hypothetical protein
VAAPDPADAVLFGEAIRRTLHERMGELGMDFAVLYPTNTLLTCAEEDEALRRGLCSGFNSYWHILKFLIWCSIAPVVCT